MKSFLQTQDWLDFQKYIGRKTWRFDDGKIRANIIQHKITFGKNYLYIPHGPEIFFDDLSGGLKNEVDNFLAYLKNLAKENRSIFIKFEPLTDIVAELVFRKGVKKSEKHIQPQKTVILNLNLPEEDLLSRMHHKTRYNIRLADKKGLQFEESTDIDMFWKLLQNTAKKDKFYTHTKDYYEKLLKLFQDGELRTKMFFVLHNDKHIAGAITMLYGLPGQGDTVYYLHGAMDRDYKELMAPYFMHWEMIRKFKDLKFKYYDFWGIDAKKWPGVSRFKLGWGGDVREYPGSFDIPISKFWYLAYKVLRKVF